ncbi:peptidoglycan-binding domain-containing protein [Streptomyces sp. L2]|uniref:peptidoglycan-binding domain-containing protein n=1 Tax=Streptomyces sp. L2 TaxID=2162665 RepID=UPI001F514757|nr:peptidoglycan-binding domain-containing protein [Streptomyces sp. L2]
MAAAGVASGLFSYAEPTRGQAAPEIRQSVPDVTPSRSASPSSAAPAVSSRPPVRSAPPAPPPRTLSSAPSPSEPTPRPSRSGSRTASPSPSVTATTTADPALRRGDTGPAVVDLQVRLAELNLYDDQVNGVYTDTVEDAVRRYQQARGIRTDTSGVYGPATRRSLESETW